jgi:isocitrate dehydrogenase
MSFADNLEKACIQTVEEGIMTKDLIGLSNLENKKGVYMAEFISAIASNLERMQK